MKTSIINNRRSGLIAGAAAALAVASLAFAGAAQARDNVTFSVGISSPGVQVGVSNAYPVYTQPRPVYVQPQPVYVQPAPVYVQPRPVYVHPRPVYYGAQPVYVTPRPVYVAPRPVYVEPRPVYHGRPHHHVRRDGGYYVQQSPRPVMGQGYGPGSRRGYEEVYYQR